MLDEKKIEELKKRVKRFIDEGTIKKERAKEQKHVEFFLNNAQKSLDAAELLFKVTTRQDLQEATGHENFDGSLWVVNASYYSMFYVARALLENEGIKLKGELSIHVLAFDALVYYFYLTNKLQKKFVEDFIQAREEASEILGQEKAKELIEAYFYERKKRREFTYEMGATAMTSKAQTSLERAKMFNTELRKIIEV